MNKRFSVGLASSPSMQPPHARLSISSRRSIVSIGPHATPTANQTKSSESASAYLSIQNDEEERRQRQLSRLQHLQNSRAHGSPGTDSASGGKDKRRSISGQEPRLTGQQLAMHYTKCIQLSAENKINMKNAFNLQLIDFMTEMLKRKDSDMNNFQVASCTLDASTKIYAYRVDSVHTDTMRMAGGLGRTQQEAAPGAGDENDPHDGQPAKIKRKRTKKAATIETNPSLLNLSSLDLEFIVDPLFKKIASQFDEGKAGGGFFLNSLMLRDDGCQLLLDSEAVLGSSDATCAAPPQAVHVTIPALPDLSKKEICPPFSSFHFTSWKVGDDDASFCDQHQNHRDDKEELGQDHAFDINAVPEPLDDDGFGDHADFGGVDEVCEDDTVAATLGEGGNNTCLTVGWEGQHAASSSASILRTVDLKEHLATASQEYSYFDARIMSAWAGPRHWKFKPVSARVKGAAQPDGVGEKKRKKDLFELNFRLTQEAQAALDKQLCPGRSDHKLSQNTIKNWCEANTTLPTDLRFDPGEFSRFHCRDEVVVVQSSEDLKAANEHTQHDDGSHLHDQPVDDDDEGCQDNANMSGGGYDMTLFSQTLAPSVPATGASGDFCGDNLVAAPSKVAKINIGYARTAKRMDMKKLKGAIWDMLTPAGHDKENDKNSVNVDTTGTSVKDRMADSQQFRFSEVYKTLPRRLNARMSENLSFPLAFIALLHLCNEKNLALTPTGNMADFVVQQG